MPIAVVRNNSWNRVTVFLSRDGFRIRLCELPAASEETARIQSETVLSGRWSIYVRTINETWLSQPETIYKDSRLEVEIQNLLSTSSFAVYPAH